MAWLTWILKFKVLKTFITITRGLKITFVGRSHVAPGDKTVLSNKQPVTGTFYLRKFRTFVTFYVLKDILGVFCNFYFLIS